MNIRELIADIRDEQIASQNKRAIIVEGKDDVEAFTILLNRAFPEWERHWILAEAGNKTSIQKILQLEEQWLGVVDRDEWSDDVITERQAATPNLFILPRFCQENYLIDPDELWPAIPQNQRDKINSENAEAQTHFRHVLLQDLPRYLRHGVLWRVIAPLWSGLRSRGFTNRLAAENSVDTAQNDEEIRECLENWDELLNPSRIFAEFQQQLAIANEAEQTEQLRHWVHGKVFWKDVTLPRMNHLFMQRSEKAWRVSLWQDIPTPNDLNPLIARLRQSDAEQHR